MPETAPPLQPATSGQERHDKSKFLFVPCALGGPGSSAQPQEISIRQHMMRGSQRKKRLSLQGGSTEPVVPLVDVSLRDQLGRFRAKKAKAGGFVPLKMIAQSISQQLHTEERQMANEGV